jgi:hypothetical protein
MKVACWNSQSGLELRPGWMPSQHRSAEGASRCHCHPAFSSNQKMAAAGSFETVVMIDQTIPDSSNF